MRLLKRHFLFTALIAIAIGGSAMPLRAQTGNDFSAVLFRDEAEPTSDFITTIWRTGEGLPVDEIHHLKETPDGYLWLGTQQGLVRFDGARFESFYNTPTGRRFGTSVGPLETDSRGELWFVPDQVGLVRRNASGFTEFLTNGTVLQNRIVSLASDGTNGLLWVDTRGNLGRVSIDRPGTTELQEQKGMSGASRIIRDFKGNLWLTDQRSLKILEKGKWREVAVPGNASTFTAAPRRDGGMWIAREAKLRFVQPDGTTREIASAPWAGQSRVTCLFEDSQQRLWIGTLGQGLYCYTSFGFQRVVSNASIVSSILEDQQNNIWVGTRGSGLVRVRPRQFFNLGLAAGLKNEFVRSLAEDKNGRLWLTTVDGRLGWFQDGIWHDFGRAEGWKYFDSVSLLPRRDGSIWISTIHRGMWRWAGGTLAKVDLGPNALAEPPVDLLEDRQGRLWMVTDNSGISCLEGDRLTRYSTTEGLPSTHIRAIVEDDAGGLWAGDWEGAIARFHDGHWSLVRQPSGHVDAVQCMVAVDGALWIGTSNGGLLRLKNGQTMRVDAARGLPDACVRQLLLDGRDSLWGATPHKLFRISTAQLNEVADGRRQKIEAITYGRSDGFPDVSFANWCDPRCCRTADGELWFATANGAVHFQPSNLREIKPPQVVIEQVLLDGKAATSADLQHLHPSAHRVEFRFTAPCLAAADRVHFRYQLTGVDSDWVEAGNMRAATYGSIPPGHHVFEVMASSPEGVWNPRAASIPLAVHPYFWQTKWFIAVVAAAVASTFVWLLRRATVRRLKLRVEQLHQQQAIERERARIAQDIHDELGANLTSIGLLADMGTRHKTDPTAVSRDLGQISQTARESVAAMDAIVWALNPRNDSLDHFANYMAQFTRDFFRPTSLRTRLDLPTNLPEIPMATEIRHQLFLIVKESFNNIVRHAEATEVSVELCCDNGRLHLAIGDDGKGMGAGTAGEGHDGLANLKERVERLGGTLTINSMNGRGTRLEFRVPLSKSNRDSRTF